MREDVRHLAHASGVQGFSYREIGAAEEGQAALERWPLLNAAARPLLAARPPRAAELQAETDTGARGKI